jgi:hypothetical protein
MTLCFPTPRTVAGKRVKVTVQTLLHLHGPKKRKPTQKMIRTMTDRV